MSALGGVLAVDVAVDVLAVDGDALAGPAALVLVLVLLVATFFLVRNMDKRLKRLPRSFDEPPAPPGPPGAPEQRRELD